MTKEVGYETLNQKNRVYIIKSLLQKGEMTQPKINSILMENGIISGDNPRELYPIFDKLYEDKIIDRESIIQKGRGGNPLKCKLIENHNAMIKIIKEINDLDPKIIPSKINEVFINSEYAQKLINNEFTNLIEQKLNEYINTDIKLTFSDKEKRVILNILQASFSAVNFALNESKRFVWDIFMAENRDQESIKSLIENIKKLFISYLIIRLGDDAVDGTTNKGKEYNYNISVKFSDIEPIIPNMEPFPAKLTIEHDKAKLKFNEKRTTE